jgi:hypothetical protein
VLADLLAYGRYVSDDGLVVLHDILMLPSMWGTANAVGRLWSHIRRHVSCEELTDTMHACTPEAAARGAASWGFGLVRGREYRRAYDRLVELQRADSGRCPETTGGGVRAGVGRHGPNGHGACCG